MYILIDYMYMIFKYVGNIFRKRMICLRLCFLNEINFCVFNNYLIIFFKCVFYFGVRFEFNCNVLLG